MKAKTLKSIISIGQTLLICWFALYGAFHLPSFSIPEGYTVFNFTTGIWFSTIGLVTLIEIINAVHGTKVET